MKKLILPLLLTLALTACTTVPAQTQQPTQQATLPAATAEPTTTAADATPTAEPTPMPTGKDARIDSPKTADITTVEQLQTLYEDPEMLLVGVDKLGRTFEAATGNRQGRETGIFFWPWFSNYGNKTYDNTEILKLENGIKILTSMDKQWYDASVSPAGAVHWWGQPLWGYYNSNDEWVLRRQLILLSYAGIDYLCFDCTNNVDFINEARLVLRVASELIEEGYNCPRFTFMTHFKSIDTAKSLYHRIYKANYCPEAWYTKYGKPFIIAYDDPAEDKRNTGISGYNPTISQEMLDYFTFAQIQWPYDPFYKDGIPWVEWTYPARVHTGFDVMNVSVASHPGCPFSFSLTRPGHTNWGRGYDVATRTNKSEDVEKGTYYQSTWDVALEEDPSMIFIGGWNEWTMSKNVWDGEYDFCDNVNMEYSRDIEPMKGGYEDNFYLQTISNIRQYAYTTGKVTASFANATPVTDADWQKVSAVYKNFNTANLARDYDGAATDKHYTQAAAVNNIFTVKVAKDDGNYYFYAECENNVVNGNNFMQLFIGTGDVALKGWNGYEYGVNLDGNGGIFTLDAGFDSTKAGNATVAVNGKTVTITVPKAVIGSGSIYFKLADGVENPADIMDYYISGCSVPMGRLSYRYFA